MTVASKIHAERTEAGFSPPAGTQMSGGSASLAHTMADVESDATSVAPSSALPPGAIVGERYVVECHISSGSFGAVYKAADRYIDNHAVALKLLHRPAASESERDAALRELRLLASVSHPSVVQFKDYGWVDGRMWFTMPWYDGITLQQRMHPAQGRTEALTRKQARSIFERLAYGLAAMHEVGIHHHDIKPDNIFLANVAGFDEGLPVLLDLGVAAKTGETPVGFTTEYVAPETAAAALGTEGIAIGPKADVFALALTLRNSLCPESAPSAEGEAIPLLNQRAHNAIEPPGRRELRFLGPSFRRWLSLDPESRPDAEQLAGQLSVLTQPEERREALRKTLWRTVPLVLLFGVVVLSLSSRVEKQTAKIKQQRVQLSAQQREADRLRQETDDNLEQMEAQLAAMDEQDEKLQKALRIARRLERRLRNVERSRRGVSGKLEAANTKLKEIQKSHDDLARAGEALTAEHDVLRRDHNQLRAAESRLIGERDALAAQRQGLSDDLVAVRRLAAEDKERALIAEQQLQRLRGQQSRLVSQLDKLTSQLATARAQVSAERRVAQQLRRDAPGDTPSPGRGQADLNVPSEPFTAPIMATPTEPSAVPSPSSTPER